MAGDINGILCFDIELRDKIKYRELQEEVSTLENSGPNSWKCEFTHYNISFSS